MTQEITLKSLWDDAYAATLDEPGKLLYRSNLLGADKRITNYGGGNTSAKVMEIDPLTGQTVKVLWVKGSGGDVGTIKLDGFATLYQDKLEALKGIYKGVEMEDDMVGLLPHCPPACQTRAVLVICLHRITSCARRPWRQRQHPRRRGSRWSLRACAGHNLLHGADQQTPAHPHGARTAQPPASACG